MRCSCLFYLRCLLYAVFLFGMQAKAYETIKIDWQSPQVIAEALMPLLTEHERVSYAGHFLILEADASRMAYLRSIVMKLDHAPSMLLLEIEQKEERGQRAYTYEVPSGFHVLPQEYAPSPPAHHQNQHGSSRMNLRLLDGAYGLVRLGSERPIPWMFWHPQRGLSRYHEKIQGFFVVPRLVGHDEVSVSLGVHQNAQSMQTHIKGKLGQWLDVGWIGKDQHGQSWLWLGGYVQHLNRYQSIRVRVVRE